MSSQKMGRIGVLTGGGDCPGLNAVIRAVVKTGTLQHRLEVVGIEDGYLGLITDRMRVLTTEDVSNILTVGGTILGACNKADPQAFAVQENGQWVKHDVTDEVIATCRRRGLQALVVIGGDGTMTGAAHLVARGLRVVGVPKTIDNDLPGTDMTFGHDTAVTIAAEALDRVHTTASSHHRVMVVELMGRYAGWLALRAGLASGADVILIPEIPFDLDAVAETCLHRSKVGKRFTIIAAGEGARQVGGTRFVERIDQRSPDPLRLGGVARFVAEEVEKCTGLESRHMVLGHVQRGGTPTPHDRVLATLLAHHAMQLLAAGRFNELVVVRNGRLGSVPIEDIAGKTRTVPPDDPLILVAWALGTCLGDRADMPARTEPDAAAGEPPAEPA